MIDIMWNRGYKIKNSTYKVQMVEILYNGGYNLELVDIR